MGLGEVAPDMLFTPPISIIIAVKNAKEHLQETLKSIAAQNYAPLEVIIVDGGSTDGSVDIINHYADLITAKVSEADNGISDAFNKGLKLASGTYINFQGAGDTLYAPDCLQRLFADLDEGYALICGKVQRVAEDGSTPIWIAPKQAGIFQPASLRYKMSLPHQGLFTHKDFFARYGHFDTQLRFAMDYELLLRAYHTFPKTIVKDILISRWRAGGVGSNRIVEIFDEYHAIKSKHGVASKGMLQFIDQFTRVKYWLKSGLGLAY
jgi:glycosyltransferase involved in cell wall biosynthesis